MAASITVVCNSYFDLTRWLVASCEYTLGPFHSVRVCSKPNSFYVGIKTTVTYQKYVWYDKSPLKFFV